MLWFDVEERYKTMSSNGLQAATRLWFDVEERYKTIEKCKRTIYQGLWFDVEERYKTIIHRPLQYCYCCGLM